MSDFKITSIKARDIPDAWFQAVVNILDNGRRFVIDRGSYAGQTRLEYDYFTCHINDPSHGSGTPEILPDIPPSIGIPNPVEFGYVYGGEGYTRSYVEYVMTPTKEINESYTYGERLTKFRITAEKRDWYIKKLKEIVDLREFDGKILSMEKDGSMYLNQVEWVIATYKNLGHRNNQMVLQVAMPDDVMLLDPPCLRSIDTRIQDNKLHFVIYFRSWDLWNGLPANLAGIEALHQYMAGQIGVQQGSFIIESKGLHLYGYAEDLANMRCLKEKGVN